VTTSNFWDVQTSGQAGSTGGEGKTTVEMQDPNTFMAAGWDSVGQPDGPHDLWAEPPGGGYPILWWQLSPLAKLPTFSGGSGEAGDPYRISTAAELNGIGHNPRLMGAHFVLVNDIDLGGIDFYIIGSQFCPFTGSFNGNAHIVSHLTITGEDYLGLFGRLGPGAEVKDLGVVDVNITGSGDYVGGLVGWKGGTLTRCHSTGTVSGSGYFVGGLVGSNNGTVTQCYSASAVSGTDFVGGLVGYNNEGSLTNCYSTGAVVGVWGVGGLVGYNYYGSAVTNCYSTGAVTGNTDVGGLVGWSADIDRWVPVTIVTNCFWDTQTSGQDTSDCGTGKTTSQMQRAKTFLEAGWDFVNETANGTEDIWWILEGKDYPRLWWERNDETSQF